MTGGWGRATAVAVGCAAALGTAQGTADAQEASAFSITGSIRSSLDIDDNRSLDETSPGTDTRFKTTLGFNVLSETPTSTLSLSFGADLQVEDRADDENENGIENPYLNFGYALEGADSRLSIDGTYRTDDVEDTAFIDTNGDFIEDTLLARVGRLESTSLSLGYSYGLEAPFGFDVNLSRRDRNYSNTIDPDLFDTTTDSARLTTRFRVSPVATARVFASLTEYDAEDVESTERTTESIGVGLFYEISPDLRFDGEISRTKIEETELILGSPVVDENTGTELNLTVTRDLANGTIGVTAARLIGTDTTRQEVSVFRDMALPAGALAFAIGVSDSDTGNRALIGSLNYQRDLPSGVFLANLSRTADVNDDDEEVSRTIAGVSYNHEINAISNLTVGLEVARTEDIGLGTIDEATRADLNITYRRELTEDWDWTLGYRGRYLKEADGGSATSNGIITTVGRSFSIRP